MQIAGRDTLTIRRIVKVDHTGEHGAIQIYSAQIVVAQRLWPDVVPTLREMLSHEIEHRARFLAAMTPRAARPCRIMSLWSVGGWLLDFATALLGRRAIWVCTAAVEQAVHRHLDDQLRFLCERDPDLHDLITSIRVEEQAHLCHARAHLPPQIALAWRALARGIEVAMDGLIWLSTWGDSTRLSRDISTAPT